VKFGPVATLEIKAKGRGKWRIYKHLRPKMGIPKAKAVSRQIKTAEKQRQEV
jgi:hypothetical protein